MLLKTMLPLVTFMSIPLLYLVVIVSFLGHLASLVVTKLEVTTWIKMSGNTIVYHLTYCTLSHRKCIPLCSTLQSVVHATRLCIG